MLDIYGADMDSFDDFPVELYDVDDTVMEYSITEREQSCHLIRITAGVIERLGMPTYG